MKELEAKVKRFGNYINDELIATTAYRYMVWQLYVVDGELKARVHPLADDTDKKTLEEWRTKGWIVMERGK